MILHYNIEHWNTNVRREKLTIFKHACNYFWFNYIAQLSAPIDLTCVDIGFHFNLQIPSHNDWHDKTPIFFLNNHSFGCSLHWEYEKERVVPWQACYCVCLVEHGGVNVSLITLTHNTHPVMGMEQHEFSAWLRNPSAFCSDRSIIESAVKNKDSLMGSGGAFETYWSHSQLKRCIICLMLEEIGNERTIQGYVTQREQETAFADSQARPDFK